jgi:TPR repeat protein
MLWKRVSLPVLITLMLTAGYAEAEFYAGRDAFRRGDYATALKELQPEADRNNPEAIAIIARMYQGGFGVKKDIAKATALFKRAAELGDPESAYDYGIARALGDGVEADLGEGLKWLYISQRLGNEKAQTYLKTLKMPSELTAEARLEAAKWHAAFKKKQDARLKAEEAADTAKAKQRAEPATKPGTKPSDAK